MSTANNFNTRASCVGLGTLGVLPFYLFEVMASAREPHWMGMQTGEWLLTLPPLILYWVFITATSLLIDRLSSKVSSADWVHNLSRPVASMISTWMLYLILRHNLEASLRTDLDSAFLGSVGILIIGSCIKNSAGFSFLPASIAGLCATVAAATTLQTSASTLFIHDFGIASASATMIRHAVSLGGLALLAGVVASRNVTLGWVVTSAVCLVSLAAPWAIILRAEQQADRTRNRGPNVVMITADTMRADYASVYGGRAATPVLEGLAATGAKFNRAVSPAPWTVPSLNAIFSSKYPPSVTPGLSEQERNAQLGLYGQIPSYWLGGHGRSFVRNLGDRGYATGGFIGNAAVRHQHWLLDDFDSVLVMQHVLDALHGPFSKSPFIRSLIRNLAPSLYEVRPRDYTQVVNEFARAFIRYRKSERFFLWAHYLDPHTPYDPPEAFRTMSGPFPFLPLRGQPHHREHKDYIRSLYAAEISYVDDSIGGILRTLRKLGLENSTYVVFSSDHGEELWDHGKFGHGHSMFDELLRVPLIVTGPGIPPQQVDQAVTMIDLLPTMAEWTGVEPDPEWNGSSWADALWRNDFGRPEVPIFSQATGTRRKTPEPLQAVSVGDYKLIVGMKSGRQSLYDHASDPGEHRNLARTRKSITRRLQSDLDRWSQSFPVTLDVIRDKGTIPTPDPEMLENLRVLGYLPADEPAGPRETP